MVTIQTCKRTTLLAKGSHTRSCNSFFSTSNSKAESDFRLEEHEYRATENVFEG